MSTLADGPTSRRSDVRHDAAGDPHVARDLIEREPFAEDIAVVERNAPWQRLQRKHAEKLAGARLELGEPARADVDAEHPGERRVIEFVRRAGPG